MTESFSELLDRVIPEYLDAAAESFYARLDAWEVDIFDKETNDVVGGLLARQLSLATAVASSPLAWTPYVLPIILRCMADVYITFCWILADKQKRSRLFIEYGLGQEKLAIEKYKELIEAEEHPDPLALESIAARERMLDAERLSFLIPVNLGSWSEMDLRKMAIEVGEQRVARSST